MASETQAKEQVRANKQLAASLRELRSANQGLSLPLLGNIGLIGYSRAGYSAQPGCGRGLIGTVPPPKQLLADGPSRFVVNCPDSESGVPCVGLGFGIA